MILKKGQKLFALARTKILEIKIIAIINNKYIIEGFFDNRGRGETREYSESLLENSRIKPYNSKKGAGVDSLVFFISRIMALNQFYTNILIEMKQEILILPRHQLEDILEDIESKIDQHRTEFFAKNISDGTETAEQETIDIKKKELA